LKPRDLLVLPYPVFNEEAYLFLGDIHKPKCHRPPKKNLMFLIIGEKLLPWLSVRSKATDDTLHALRKNALLFRPWCLTGRVYLRFSNIKVQIIA
jgi:hypothetical protein